jgi:hypothetical protein
MVERPGSIEQAIGEFRADIRNLRSDFTELRDDFKDLREDLTTTKKDGWLSKGFLVGVAAVGGGIASKAAGLLGLALKP